MRKCEAMLAAPLDLLKDERECSDNMNFGHTVGLKLPAWSRGQPNLRRHFIGEPKWSLTKTRDLTKHQAR